MDIKELDSFYLVGGTCLSLRYGHRTSIDLDLFSTKHFENREVIDILEKYRVPFEYRDKHFSVGLFGFVNDIKVDFVQHHHFSLIGTINNEENIRSFSDRDIMAMKIFAILQRAQKKDFWDIAELLKHYSLQDMIDAYLQKYPSQQLIISIPTALTYFEDAENSEEPVSLKGQTWESIKKSIVQHVNKYVQ